MKVRILTRTAAALFAVSVTLGSCAIVAERGYYGHHYHYRYYEPYPYYYGHPPGYYHPHRGYYHLQLEDTGQSQPAQQHMTADVGAE